MSPSVSGSSWIMLTAFTRRLGFWIISCASFMNSAKAVPLAAVDLEMREDLVAHEREHLVGAQVPELRPAQVLLVILEAALERLAGALLRGSRRASR